MTKTKALCVATRCTTTEQFVATFHRFCDEKSFFVATLNSRPVGLETPFAIQLANRTPVLRGLCVVLAAWTTPDNVYKRPGIRLGIKRLTPESEIVFEMLQEARTAGPIDAAAAEGDATVSEAPVPIALPAVSTAPKPAPLPLRVPMVPIRSIAVPVKATPVELPNEAIDTPSPLPSPSPQPERTPGGDLVLPANPLMNLSDESLEGFVDCTLYEETATFFRAPEDGEDDDDVAPPPVPASGAVPGDNVPLFQPASLIGEGITVAGPVAAVLEPPAPQTAAPVVAPIGVPAAAIPQHLLGTLPPLATPPLIPVTPPPLPVAATAATPPAMPPLATPNAHAIVVAPPPRPHVIRPESDTSTPIDLIADADPGAPARGTPVPAGERFAPVIARAGRRKLVLAGGAIAVAVVALVVIVRTRGSRDANPDAPRRAAIVEPPVVVARPVPPEPVQPASTDKPELDGDEVAETSQPTIGIPVVGEGPCRLDVTTTPAGTLVLVDGQSVGPSPISIAGPCQKRRVDLTHPRYKAAQKWVTLDAAKSTAIDVMMTRPTHALQVITNPPGATISIGGRRAGTSPTIVQLMGFSGIDVKIERRGFESVTKRVYSKTPQDKLAVTLKRSLWK